MLYVGLTGGIGSGKSTVSARFAELGAVVIDADALAREVVAPGTDGLAEIATRFGQQVLLSDGSLNRPALGEIVFADEAARRDLEAITHPRIRELTAARHAAAPREAIVVHDMPLLVEGDLAPDYHLAVIVDATRETRTARIMRDRGMTEQEASARIAAQATDEQRHAVADVVLDNNGTRDQLLDHVETLWRERLSPYNENLLADRGVRRPLPTKLADPDPGWSHMAQRATARITRQLSTAGLSERIRGVEQIGSTSVPGLTAKEVIDLQVRVHDLELAATPQFRDALRNAGFVDGQRKTNTTQARTQNPELREYSFNGADPIAVQQLHVRHADSGG